MRNTSKTKCCFLITFFFSCTFFLLQGMNSPQLSIESIPDEVMLSVPLFIMRDCIDQGESLSCGVGAILNSFGRLNKRYRNVSLNEDLWKALFNLVEEHYKIRGVVKILESALERHKEDDTIKNAFRDYLKKSGLVKTILNDDVVVKFFKNPGFNDEFFDFGLTEKLTLALKTQSLSKEQQKTLFDWGMSFIDRQENKRGRLQGNVVYLLNLLLSRQVDTQYLVCVSSDKNSLERNRFGETELIRATRQRDLEKMKEIVGNAKNKETLLKAQDCIGMDALLCATFLNFDEGAVYLLNQGAPSNQRNKLNETSLSYAVKKSNREIINALSGQSVPQKTERGFLSLIKYYVGLEKEKIGSSVNKEIIENSELLIEAVARGRVDIVEKLCELRSMVNPLTDSEIDNLVNKAAQRNNVVLVEKFYEEWWKKRKVSNFAGAHPIINAANWGAYDVVSLFLTKYREDLNDEYLRETLRMASGSRSLKLVELLKAQGASFKGEMSGDSLIAAIMRKDQKTACFILNDPNLSYEMCRRVLKIAEKFLPNFAPTLRDAAIAKCPVDQAVIKQMIDVAAQGDLEVLKKFLEKGTDLNLRELETGENAIRAAIRNGQVEVVKFLLNNSPSDDKSGYWGYLDYKKENSAEIAQLLIDQGAIIKEEVLCAAINQDNKELIRVLLKADKTLVNRPIASVHDYTPLMIAVAKGDEGLIRLLLGYGAEPIKGKSSSGHTAYWLAEITGQPNIREIFIKHVKFSDILQEAVVLGKSFISRAGLNRTDNFIDAAANGNLAKVKEYIANKIDINGYHSEDGRTALIDAAGNGQYGVVHFLLDQSSIETRRCSKDNAFNVLSAACAFNNPQTTNLDTVRYLVEIIGMNVDIGAHSGAPPLINAINCHHFAIAEYLLKHGANVNICCRGATSSIVAACKGDVEAVRFLLKNGADVTIKDLWGKSAIDHAREKGHHEIVDILENHMKKKEEKES